MSRPASSNQPSLDLPIPEPIDLKLPEPGRIVYKPIFKPAIDGRYRLMNLLAYHDRDFIHAAYWALLQRAPDEEGFGTYLGHLRDGMPKIQLLGALRSSSEGRKVSAEVPGLSLQLFIQKISRWPLIGPLVRVSAALWNLPEEERRRKSLEGQIISRMEEGQVNMRETQLATVKALRDLEHGSHLLRSYTASKPGGDALRRIDSSKADLSSVDETRRLLVLALETRPERHELTALTNYLVAMAQLRLTKDDIAPIEQAYDALRRQSNTDRATFESAIEHLKIAIETERSDTRTVIETALQGIHRVLARLTRSKAD